ncbi:LysM peptidoglycan-binding domain-containing protein [Fructilactobacillus florum]|uniref:LysM peptidoglycan-binding domain-containing protein n=1 Tax=Fructilactobacillus florum TaxID=640331 RepID=UPI002092C4CC|nr:LysM peptidoglycan-binding domain-containing protein [Fructilactobacillus florum]
MLEKNHANKGLTAIYRADMSETTVIMLVESAPTETVNSSNATYPTPSAEPRINYSVNTDKTLSASYILYGNGYNDIVSKYQKLLTWQMNGVQLTIDGFSYLPNVYFTSVARSMSEPRVNSMDLAISFTSALHAIERTTVTVKPPQPPTPPPAPNPGVWITVTRGMTYWWMWTKWGTSIQQLRDWNHYPDRFIPIGVRVRVA